ncbi:MAG: hypothetical protein AAGG11_12910 [Pseudomonadota bacterium]
MNQFLKHVGLLGLLLPVQVLACRCEQQPLANYFEAAEFVAIAKLIREAADADRRVLTFVLSTAPYKAEGEAADYQDGEELQFQTALSSAGCGVPADIGGTYVLFAPPAAEAGGLRAIDSCSGTRLHLPANLAEPAGFMDVPARFVPSQLIAAQGLEVLRQVAASAPRIDDPDNTALLGLLDLKALAHGGLHIVYEEPSAAATEIGRIDSYDDVRSREFDYELPGAVVYTKRSGWYRIRLSTGRYGWLRAEDAGTWFPYPELPVRRLAYLETGWSGLIWPGPGAGNPRRRTRPTGEPSPTQPIEVLEARAIGGMPWFRINLLQEDPCVAGNTAAAQSGWVPGYGRSGQPSVWFYSRGC